MSSKRDFLYANPLGEIEAFKFDQAVVDVFSDMIVRSVPGYRAIISAIGQLAGRFSQDGSLCYDLGCSLGAASLAMRDHIKSANCKIIAVDNSQAMIDSLQARLQSEGGIIEAVCADIRDIKIANASVVVLNFTLQFIPLSDRADFVAKIYQGLRPGGALILSEKLAHVDARQAALHIEMHHVFKKMQGYSDLEISQKRAALENVLVPESFVVHERRLLDAGFDSVAVWFQYFNFASMIALK